MDADKKNRGGYIKEDGSDFIVGAILERKEHLLHYNPKGMASGALLRKAAADEVVAEFNRKFPGLNKNYEQIKKNFDKRRDTLKRALMLERSYVNGTGGGRDPKVEADIAKLQNPSLADGQLIAYLKRTDGLLGVGDLSLETGHTSEAVNRRKMSAESVEESDDEPCGSKSIKKKASSSKVSDAGIERAKKLSHLEFIKAKRPEMIARATEMGFRKGYEGDIGALPAKKMKSEGHGMETAISQVVTVVERLEGRMGATSGKGLAAIEGMEQLRAAVRYGGSNLTPSDLQEILDCYDRKVRAAEATGSEESPINIG